MFSAKKDKDAKTGGTKMDRNVGRWWALLIVLGLATSTTRGDVFYVAVDGRPENNGSPAKPWPSVEYALAQVGGGHNLIVNNTVVDNNVGILLYNNCSGEKVYNNIVAANKRSFDVRCGLAICYAAKSP